MGDYQNISKFYVIDILIVMILVKIRHILYKTDYQRLTKLRNFEFS